MLSSAMLSSLTRAHGKGDALVDRLEGARDTKIVLELDRYRLIREGLEEAELISETYIPWVMV